MSGVHPTGNVNIPSSSNRPRFSQSDNDFSTPTVSPATSANFLVPSPVVTRRMRTVSASHRATEGPVNTGVCTFFSRSQGHGFIRPNDDKPDGQIFMHVSDISSDYIPLPGDLLSYKLCKIPPRNTKYQAVEVEIMGLSNEGDHQHKKWSDSTMD